MPVLLPLLLLTASLAAHALPIDLANADYATAAFVELGDAHDGVHSAATPTDALPLASHALLQNDTGDRTAADAVADVGLLAVSTDVGAVLAATSAVADASLHLELDQPGDYRLSLLFENTLALSGLGSASALLGLTVDVAGTVVFDESFDAGAAIDRAFSVAPGQFAVLDLHLQSLADALVGDGSSIVQLVPADDSGFALASVTAGLDLTARAVPTPATATLVCAALLPMVRLRARRPGIGRA